MIKSHNQVKHGVHLHSNIILIQLAKMEEYLYLYIKFPKPLWSMDVNFISKKAVTVH